MEMKNVVVKRTNRQLTGNKGEDIACAFIENKGYKVVSRNFRVTTGEIDIIAEKDEYIIFVEVKTRSTRIFGSAAQAVDYKKQRSIISAAQIYLSSIEDEDISADKDKQPRFDVIEVYIDKKSGKNYVNHIECAFIT